MHYYKLNLIKSFKSENQFEDGPLIGTFVDSDCYMAVGKLFKDS